MLFKHVILFYDNIFLCKQILWQQVLTLKAYFFFLQKQCFEVFMLKSMHTKRIHFDELKISQKHSDIQKETKWLVLSINPLILKNPQKPFSDYLSLKKNSLTHCFMLQKLQRQFLCSWILSLLVDIMYQHILLIIQV